MAEPAGAAAAELGVDGARLTLAGVLDLHTVGAVLEPGRRAIDGVVGERAVLDLAAVRRSDSAGLALVVDWLRAARRRGLDLAIEGAPPQLADIARVSGLDGLIGVEDDGADR